MDKNLLGRRIKSTLFLLIFVFTGYFSISVDKVDAYSAGTYYSIKGDVIGDYNLSQTFKLPSNANYIDSVSSLDGAKFSYTFDKENKTITINSTGGNGTWVDYEYSGLVEGTTYVSCGGMMCSGWAFFDNLTTASPNVYNMESALWMQNWTEISPLHYSKAGAASFSFDTSSGSDVAIGPWYYGTNYYLAQRGDRLTWKWRYYNHRKEIIKPQASFLVNYSDEKHYWSKHPKANPIAKNQNIEIKTPEISVREEAFYYWDNYHYDESSVRYGATGTNRRLDTVGEVGYQSGSVYHNGEYLSTLLEYTLKVRQVNYNTGAWEYIYEKRTYIRGPSSTKGDIIKTVEGSYVSDYPRQGINVTDDHWYTYLGDTKPNKTTVFNRYEAKVKRYYESDWTPRQEISRYSIPSRVYNYYVVKNGKLELSNIKEFESSSIYNYGYVEDGDKKKLYRWQYQNGKYYQQIRTLDVDYTKGKYVNKVEDYAGAYPNGGVAFDGYYYEEYINTPPKIEISVSGDRTITHKSPNFNLMGMVSDAEGDNVTISTTIGGKKFSTVVENATAKLWTLKATGIPDGVYNNITVVASDGDKETSVVYKGTLTVDTTGPTAVVSVSSSNLTDSRYAGLNHLVGITIEANEPLMEAPVVTMGKQTLTANKVKGNIYTAVFKADETLAEGKIPISVALLKDVHGNSGKSYTDSTDGSYVLFYNSAPTIKAISIVSNNAATYRAKVGDTIIVTFVSDRGLNTSTTSAFIAGNRATVSKVADNTYRATYVIQQSDSEGLISFNVTPEDLAANKGVASTKTTDGSYVDMNKTAPVATSVSIKGSSGNDTRLKVGESVTITLKTDKVLLGNPTAVVQGRNLTFTKTGSSSFSASTVITAADAEGRILFTLKNIKDLYGNIASDVSSTTDGSYVDFYKPAVLSIVKSSVSVTKYPGQRLITLTGKVYHTAKESTVVSATIAGVTKSVTVTTPTNLPSSNNFTLTWDTVADKMTVGTYNNISVTATNFYGTTTATNTMDVTFTELYMWEKYNLKNVTYGDRYYVDGYDSRYWVEGSSYTETYCRTLATSTGVCHEWATRTVTTPGYWSGSYTPGYWVDTTYTVQEKDKYLEDVVASKGTYPDNGIQGSYWYILKGIYVPEPVLTLDTQGLIYVSEVDGRRIFTITGKTEDAGGSVVTVSATVAGVRKSQTVIGTSKNNPKAFTLSWDAKTDAIPEGTYQNIVVKSENTTAFTEKTTTSLKVIVDKTKPVADPVSMRSNNADPNYAKVGDQIAVMFNTSETLVRTPSVKVRNKELSVVNSGTSYTSTRTLTIDDDEGSLDLLIEYEDLAGNKNTTTSTTDGGKVTYYSVPPVLDKVDVITTNADPERARVGDQIKVEFTLNKDWKPTPVVIVADRYATLESKTDSTYTFTTTMRPNDREGVVDFKISNVSDAAGNSGVITTYTTEGKRVLFDETPPTFNSVTLTEQNNKAVLELVASEVLRNPPQVTIAGEVSPVISEANNTVFTVTSNKTVEELGESIGFEVKNYQDLAGNLGTTVTKPTTPSGIKPPSEIKPTANKVSIYSSNSTQTIAVEGDTVFLEFTSSKTLAQKPTVLINNEPASVVNVSGNVWRASRVFWSGDKSGPVSFVVSDILDTSNNQGNNIEQTTDGSFVNYGKFGANLSFVGVKSTNKTNNLAKVGDTVRVTFSSNKQLGDYPSVLVGGNTALLEKSSTNMKDFSYVYVMTEADSEGKVDIRISDVQDIGGNDSAPTETTTDGSYVTFDKTAPRLGDVRISKGSKVGETLVINFNASETLSKTPSASVGGVTAKVEKLTGSSYKVSQTITEAMIGKLDFYINNIEDLAGNIGDPVTNLSNGSSSVIESSGVLMITLSGIEEGKSYNNVATPVFSATSAVAKTVSVTATLDGKSIKSGQPVRDKGSHTLVITAKDSSGNNESLSVSFTVK